MISLRDFEFRMTRQVLRNIDSEIHLVRGQRVMLDSVLAEIYGVSTKRLNEQLKRNRKRFPADFAFQLTAQEFMNLRSQIATSSAHGGRSEEHTSELQSPYDLVCRLLLEKKKK